MEGTVAGLLASVLLACIGYFLGKVHFTFQINSSRYCYPHKQFKNPRTFACNLTEHSVLISDHFIYFFKNHFSNVDI